MRERRAILRIEELCGPKLARLCTPWIRAATAWPGSESLFGRITSAGGKGEAEDYLAELRFALVFEHLGFAVEIEPLGREGPDLGISRGDVAAIVEVARFRPMYLDPPEPAGDLLAEYGDFERDVTKSLEKLVGKFRQLDGELSVIAIWNDDDALEELEMSEAVRIAAGLDDLPPSLRFVLYGSAWHRPWRELLCYSLRPVDDQVQQWMNDLQAVRMSEALPAVRVAEIGGAAQQADGTDAASRRGSSAQRSKCLREQHER